MARYTVEIVSGENPSDPPEGPTNLTAEEALLYVLWALQQDAASVQVIKEA